MKRLNSVLTNDMDACIFTGSTVVERHHVFGGAYRKTSEKYGFIVPLHPHIHPNGAYSDDNKCRALTGMSRKEVDVYLKRKCQEYFEEHIGDRDAWIKEFVRSWL